MCKLFYGKLIYSNIYSIILKTRAFYNTKYTVTTYPLFVKGTLCTVLAVLQKDLKATYEESIKHNLDMPFNALSSIQLFHSMGKEKPKA